MVIAFAAGGFFEKIIVGTLAASASAAQFLFFGSYLEDREVSMLGQVKVPDSIPKDEVVRFPCWQILGEKNPGHTLLPGM